MRGLDHREAVRYLRQTPNTVHLRFSRPPPQSDVEEEEEEYSDEVEEEEEEVVEGEPQHMQDRKRVSDVLKKKITL